MTKSVRTLLSLIPCIGGYLFLVAPRMTHRPDRTPFCGVFYAHRGLFDNHSDAPENSIPAFRRAVEAGYGIELDVQLSKDGIPVVFHDAGLKRMCGVDGNVWEYTLEELQNLRLAGSAARIPTFADVLAAVDGKVPLIVEYKLDVVSTKVCELGNELLKDYRGPYCIESFHPLALRWYRRHRPEIMRGQLGMDFWKEKEYRGKTQYLLLSFLLTNFLTRPDFIAFNHTDARNLSRRVCRGLGALSAAWTIRSRKQYERVKDEFDLFIFDSFRM